MSRQPQDLDQAVAIVPLLTQGQYWQQFAQARLSLFARPGVSRPPLPPMVKGWVTFAEKLQAKYDPQLIGTTLAQSWPGLGSRQQTSGQTENESGADFDEIAWELLPSGSADATGMPWGTLSRHSTEPTSPLFSQSPEAASEMTGVTARNLSTALSSPAAAKRLMDVIQPDHRWLPQGRLGLARQGEVPTVKPVPPPVTHSDQEIDTSLKPEIIRESAYNSQNIAVSNTETRLAPTQTPKSKIQNPKSKISSPRLSQPMLTPSQRWLNQIERSSYGVLSHRLQSFLEQILNQRIPNVKIYATPAADALVRQHQADALTYDDKILFKTGGYSPQNPESLALLGHELTHVAVEQGNMISPSPGTIAAEEALALRNEHRIQQYLTAQSSGSDLNAPPSFPRSFSRQPALVADPAFQRPSVQTVFFSQAQAGRESSTLGFTPKAASEDRPQATGPAPAMNPSVMPLSKGQLDQVYDYIKAKIRESGERWGVK